MAIDKPHEALHDDTVAARRIASYARDGVVAIRIGSAGTTYHVYKALIAKHSEYFDRALNKDWKEAEEGVILLDDVDCNTFEIFMDWLHTQKLPAKFSEWLEPGVDTKDISKTKLVQMAMAKACVFGDRFLAQHFRAAARHALVELLLSFSAPFYEVVTYAFDNLPAKDLVLQAMIDTHCSRTTDLTDVDSRDSQFRDNLPHSFLLGAMSRYMKIKGFSQKTPDACDYHSQGDGVKPDQKFINDLDPVSRKGGSPVSVGSGALFGAPPKGTPVPVQSSNLFGRLPSGGSVPARPLHFFGNPPGGSPASAGSMRTS